MAKREKQGKGTGRPPAKGAFGMKARDAQRVKAGKKGLPPHLARRSPSPAPAGMR